MATPSFLGIPGELRNEIYHHLFSMSLKATDSNSQSSLVYNKAKKPADFAPAPAQKKCVKLFLVCRQIRAETRELYFTEYFIRQQYALMTRHSVYAFSQLPSRWTQNIHRITLTGYGVFEGRRLVNPIKLALATAAQASLDKTGLALTYGGGGRGAELFIREKREDERVASERILQWITGLSYGTPAYGEIERYEALLRAANTSRYRRYDAHVRLGAMLIDLEVIVRAHGKVVVNLMGPLAQLDWDFIPTMRFGEENLLEPMTPASKTEEIWPTEMLAFIDEVADELNEAIVPACLENGLDRRVGAALVGRDRAGLPLGGHGL